MHITAYEGQQDFADALMTTAGQREDYASESDDAPYESRQNGRGSVGPNARSADSLLRPKSQLSAESVEMVATALEPQTIFDLPDALVQISRLNAHVELLEAELRMTHESAGIPQQERVNGLETQVLDLVEEKRQLRTQLDKTRLELFDNKENRATNIQDGQQVVADLMDQVQQLEEEKLELQGQVEHLQGLL